MSRFIKVEKAEEARSALFVCVRYLLPIVSLAKFLQTVNDNKKQSRLFLMRFFVTAASQLKFLFALVIILGMKLSVYGSNEVLLNTLRKAAGVYSDPLYNPSLNRTVIITGVNYGYLNFLYNFKCFTDRLKLKVLVFSMDSKIHAHIESESNSSLTSFYLTGNQTVNEATAIFRSSQFNIITNRKTEAVIAVMSLGYDVIFMDVDIALLRDPLPYLLWNNVDYAFSHNKICPQ